MLTQFGYHIIRVDERKGDTSSLRHILVRIQASDSSSSRIDRRADSLANIASNSEIGARLDSASKVLGLPIMRVPAFEDEPAMSGGRLIPSVSAWSFGGDHIGETSELYDDDNGYYLARLDSLYQGGDPDFDAVKNDVRAAVATQKLLDKVLPTAQQLTKAARTSTFESAAQQAGKQVEHTGLFTRGMLVPGLGQFNEAIGASFGQPIGQVGEPVRTQENIFVIRPDKRVTGDTTTFEAQKPILRAQRLQQLREQRVQMYLQDLRESAKIKDRRKELNAAARRQS
jgi:peptidyl-prolyl cis-trans isomerase D